MKTLGANSIRVYHVDPKAEHDSCMKTFADAGIYIWLDLDTFNSAIDGPGMTQPQWNETQFEAFQTVMDVFHKYDNLGGFFVGNEVLTSPETDVAAPYVKAAAADMKAYRDGQYHLILANARPGLSDDIQARATARYLSGTPQQISPPSAQCSRIILLAAKTVQTLLTSMVSTLTSGQFASSYCRCFLLIQYRCGDATYETSGYVFLQKDAAEYNIPIFFSETGCNVGSARTFADQAAIFLSLIHI